MPGWGSWDWVGADIMQETTKYYGTTRYQAGEIPDADLVVVVKHAPGHDWINEVTRVAPVIYCPVDYYPEPAAIDADACMLRRYARILVHCDGLRKYFQPYAPVSFLDHHVKYITPFPASQRRDGFILWVGVRSNLPALVQWTNRHRWPGELRVLTNLERPEKGTPAAAELGFAPGLDVVVENWSPDAQIARMGQARAALDIKAADFRSRHKPPTKAFDFLASGLPLAMNQDNEVFAHIARLGFDLAVPTDVGRWLSQEYWEETQRFGRTIRELLNLERIGRRYRRVFDEVLADNRTLTRGPRPGARSYV